MGRRGGRATHAGELSVNKKGTPLYSREDIREQYCINDKELQVLDKSQRKSLLGCFSNQGQAGNSPCTGGNGKSSSNGGESSGKNRSILGSCIARTSSEEELQDPSKRPISPGHRGTTWNGKNRVGKDGGVQSDDEADGFDDHYFRRRPKSFCLPPSNLTSQNDPRRFLPPGTLPHIQGVTIPPSIGVPSVHSLDPSLQISMGSLIDEQHQRSVTVAYGTHPIILTNVFPPPTGSQQQPSQALVSQQQVGIPLQSSTASIPSIMYPPPYATGQAQIQMVSTAGVTSHGGGYTLPPTAAYFPMATYATLQQQHQLPLSSQPPTSIQQSIADQSSQIQVPAVASTASAVPIGVPLSVADTATSSVPKSIEGTPTVTQPNTPDLLIHRRQVGTPEVSLDDRKQKHVSFDSSSLMRSQTLATMDEATFQRMAAAAALQGHVISSTNMVTSAMESGGLVGTPSMSTERLIDGRKTPDFELYSQVFPPEIARQLMQDRLKRSSMRSMATQTDVNNHRNQRHSSHYPLGATDYNDEKVQMVSEAVQTNGINNGNVYAPYLVSSNNLQLKHTQQNFVVISQPHSIPPQNSLPPIKEPLPCVTSRSQMSSQTLANQYNPSSEGIYRQPGTITNNHIQTVPLSHQIPPNVASKFPGYKLQVYHIDGGQEEQQQMPLQGVQMHSNQNKQKPSYDSSAPLHQLRMSSQTSSSTSKTRTTANIDKRHHTKSSHHTHTHFHPHHQHSHHQHGIGHTHHQNKLKQPQIGQSQYHSSPKHHRSTQQEERRNHVHKLQKSRSDGQLLDDSLGGQSTDQSTLSNASHSHKGLENVNVTFTQDSANQKLISQKYASRQPDFEKRFAQHPSCSEEEEISDRDMPELAPISQHEHTHDMMTGPNTKIEYIHTSHPCKVHEPERNIPIQPVLSSSYPHQSKSIHSCQLKEEHEVEKIIPEYGEDIDRDLGQALSPLGSTSSLQDLIESVSVPSRGDGSSKSEKLIATSLWAEQTRAMHAEQIPPVTTESVRTDSAITYTEPCSSQVQHSSYELRSSERDIKLESWDTGTTSAPPHDEREPSTSSLKSSKSGKKLKTVKVVAPEDIDADSGRGTSEDMHHQKHHLITRYDTVPKHEVRKPETYVDRQHIRQGEFKDSNLSDGTTGTAHYPTSSMKETGTKCLVEETEPCIEVEEEASTVLLENNPEDESAYLERYQTKQTSVLEDQRLQHGTSKREGSPRNVSCSDTTESCKADALSSESFQAIDEEDETLEPDMFPVKSVENEDIFEEAAEDKDISAGSSTEEIRADDEVPFLKDEEVICRDESGLGTTEKEDKKNETSLKIKEDSEFQEEIKESSLDIDATSDSSKHETSLKDTPKDHSLSPTNNVTSENGGIWNRIQGDRGDVRKKAEAFEQKIKSLSQSTEKDEYEPKEKSLTPSIAASEEGDIKVSKEPLPQNMVDDNIMSPDLGRSDDETTSQHVDSEIIFRSSCDEDDLAVNSSPRKEDDEVSVNSSLGNHPSIDAPQDDNISVPTPPPIAPKPKNLTNGSLKDKQLISSTIEGQEPLDSRSQDKKIPNVTIKVEPNNGVPLVEPPAGFGDSPVKSVKVVDIKEMDTKQEDVANSHSFLKRQVQIEEGPMEMDHVIQEGVLQKQQFANLEVLPSTENQDEQVENTAQVSNQGPIYHRPGEIQIEELASLSSALEIAPLETYSNIKATDDRYAELLVGSYSKEHEQSLYMQEQAISTPAEQFRIIKEVPTAIHHQVCADKKQKSRSRKSSSGSRERTDIVTSSSNASIQSVQTTSEVRQSPVTVQPPLKAKARSRSSSKERLLSTLANSADAPVTSHDEDDISGLYLGGYGKSAWAFIGKLSSGEAPSIGPGDEQLTSLHRSDSLESTQSEREFKKKYQAITHRMVHRKSSAVMYSKILERTFECNKTVCVMRVKGEFGFRIHGSRPVVVSAIEPNTPAEDSGLEVGDIILTINGTNVLDLPHTEVVKTAQTGCDELELGLARVEDIPGIGEEKDPMNIALIRLDDSLRIVHCGYLWKLSRSVAPSTRSIEGSDVSTSMSQLTQPLISSKWSKRWFVLRADSCLYFFKTELESRPLGAVMVSGCNIVQGCEEEDEQTGVARQYAFRLKLNSSLNKANVPASLTSGNSNTVQYEEEEAKNSRYLCLASESEGSLHKWLNTIAISAQAPDKEDLWMDITQQRMYVTPAEFPSPDCRGFLLKLDGTSKSWKRRYCILVDSSLILYTDFDALSASAAICLHGYRVQSTGGLSGSKRHAFELIPPDSHQGLKFFYFVAETETERKRWLASLEYSMDRWMKMS